MAQYENKGDRLNILLADELPEDMTGTQDTQRICGKCAWYSFAKLESICRKTGKEVAYFANKKCFTTDKEMEENNNAQPVAETGTQVCKECGRTLPLDDFQRRRNGKRDKVCKACRAEKIRVGMATGKKVKVDIPEKIAKAVSAPSPASEAALEEAVKTEGVEIAQLCRYLIEFKMAGLALWGMMPTKEEDIDHIIEAEWIISCCHEIFVAAAELKLAGAKVVPALVAKRIYWAEKFIEELGNAFYPLAKECDTSEKNPAEWSEEDKAMVGCIAVCLDGQFVTEAARKQCLEWFNRHRRDFLNRPSWKPSVGQMFVKDIGNAFYPLMKECDTSEKKPEVISPVTYVADLSDGYLLEELRRRGYKGRISKCEEVEI